jgi:transcriptional regulator with XRE-family HTH domain
LAARGGPIGRGEPAPPVAAGLSRWPQRVAAARRRCSAPEVDAFIICTYQLQAQDRMDGAEWMSRPTEFAAEVDGEEKGSRRPNPIDVHVGSRVRFRRMLLGMSQEKLGEKLGLTFQQIQKYEKGINRIGASRLFDLAQVLGVSVQFFYEEAPTGEVPRFVADGFAERPAESSIVEFLRSRDGLELNKAFVRIADVRARRAIVELVRSLAADDEVLE